MGFWLAVGLLIGLVPEPYQLAVQCGLLSFAIVYLINKVKKIYSYKTISKEDYEKLQEYKKKIKDILDKYNL